MWSNSGWVLKVVLADGIGMSCERKNRNRVRTKVLGLRSRSLWELFLEKWLDYSNLIVNILCDMHTRHPGRDVQLAYSTDMLVFRGAVQSSKINEVIIKTIFKTFQLDISKWLICGNGSNTVNTVRCQRIWKKRWKQHITSDRWERKKTILEMYFK